MSCVRSRCCFSPIAVRCTCIHARIVFVVCLQAPSQLCVHKPCAVHSSCCSSTAHRVTLLHYSASTLLFLCVCVCVCVCVCFGIPYFCVFAVGLSFYFAFPCVAFPSQAEGPHHVLEERLRADGGVPAPRDAPAAVPGAGR